VVKGYVTRLAESENASNDLSMNKFCKNENIDRKQLRCWLQEEKAGQYSSELLGNFYVNNWNKYMNIKESISRSICVKIINVKLEQLFPLESSMFGVRMMISRDLTSYMQKKT